ncbi:ABC transporter substrate-binding protein [Actinopolymorpha alba]|uniref:ABC transporter substrate-binding protein n=1 Tax=Actinopolymorpha alba TaxID=533267 RepID=UPI00036C3212|nr:ABC transporter substrate-binding protein [Actinopolymorpha alba]
MNPHLSRRRLLAVGAQASAAAAVLGLSACGRNEASTNGKVQLRISWWGAAESHKRQLAGVKAVEKLHKNLTFKPEYTDPDSYWNRLATQVSGGNAPDVLSMSWSRLAEYAGRNVLQPLDEYSPELINLDDMDKNYVDLGRVDGKLYGVGRGMTIPCVLVDEDVLKKAKVEKPPDTWTWNDFGAFAKKIHEAVGGDFYGSEDGSGKLDYLELWVRGRGGLLYDDGKIAVPRKDLVEWLEYWSELRASKACVPANVQAAYQNGVQNSPLVKGSAAILLLNSDASMNFAGLTEHRLITLVAPTGGKRVQYFRAPSMLSCFVRSPHKREAALTIGTLVANLEVAKGYGLESGPPPSKKVQKLLKSEDLDVMERQLIDFSDHLLATYASAPPPLPPKGAGEVGLILGRAAEDIAFGRIDIEAGADRFLAEAAKELASA